MGGFSTEYNTHAVPLQVVSEDSKCTSSVGMSCTPLWTHS